MEAVKLLAGVSDRELLARIVERDMVAFDELFSRYREKIFRSARRWGMCQHDCEQVLHDSMMSIWNKAKTFQNRCAVSSWIYRITFNTAAMLRRAEKRHPIELVETHDAALIRAAQDPRPEHSLDARRELSRVAEHLREDGGFGVVFVLRDVDKLSIQECAAMIGCSVPAAKSRLYRARNRLARKFRTARSLSIPRER